MSTAQTNDLRSRLLARLRQREEQAEFLVNASKLMMQTSRLVAADLDVEATLAGIARLTLPHAGVWSILDVREGDTIRRVAVSHPVARLQELARDLVTGWPPPRAEPFVRARDVYAREQDGAGLGLAITRKLARAMGGDVAATSELGSGSTFTLTLLRGRGRRAAVPA